MGVSTRKPRPFGLGWVLAAVLVCGGAARVPGQVVLNAGTDIPGALVVFPKVVNADGRDTVIMLANTQNAPLHVKCWYIGLEVVTGRCLEEDFYVSFTKQMPTSWRVSEGKTADVTSGLFGGFVQPAKPGFQGELRCLTVAGPGSDVPFPANALKGEAIIQNLTSGQVSAYNAMAFEGNAANPPVPVCVEGPPATLGKPCTLGQEGNTACDGLCAVQVKFDGAQYAACPLNIQATHHSDGQKDLAWGSSTVTGELTLVPCARNLNQYPLNPGTPERTLQVVPGTLYVHDENERDTSRGISIDCWFNADIGDVATFGLIYDPVFAGPFVKSRVGDRTNAFEKANEGLLGVFEEMYTPSPIPPTGTPYVVGTAAVNMHAQGVRTKFDVFSYSPFLP